MSSIDTIDYCISENKIAELRPRKKMIFENFKNFRTILLYATVEVSEISYTFAAKKAE